MSAASLKPIARFTGSLDRSFPVVLLLVCLAAFSILILSLGFYWDDWPWIWFFHVKGLAGLLEIDRSFRPLAGVVLAFGGLLAGEHPAGWQLYALFWRWAAALCLWWALRKTWPSNPVQVAWVALFFLVYPGFSQQFVAVNTSRHLAPLAVFFLSIGLMLQASHQPERRRLFTGAALLLALLSMLTSDYYYGLELLRPVFLWLAAPRHLPARLRLQRSLRAWLPYLVLAAAVFTWRYVISQSVNYRASLLDDFTALPAQAMLQILAEVGRDWLEVILTGWSRLLPLSAGAEFGIRSWLVYAALVLLTCLGLFLYFRQFDDAHRQSWALDALLLGCAVLLVGGLPFWISRLDVKLAFPNDRLTLPFIPGASLLLVALGSMIPPRSLRLVFLALLVGLGVGAQFRHAAAYRQDWERTVTLLAQIAGRLPQVPENTLLLTPHLPLRFSTDNSLTAALNWMYFAEPQAGRLGLLLVDTSLRFNGDSSPLQAGRTYARLYGSYPFAGSLDQALVLLFDPPACLHVLDGEVDQYRPRLGSDTRRLLAAVTSPVIPQGAAGIPAHWPAAVLGEPERQSWCAAFGRADLARQQQDWTSIQAISDQAFAQDDSPNAAAERLPFIEGFAHLERWQDALALTRETLKINHAAGPMLCAAWQRINHSTASSPDKLKALQMLNEFVDCPY